MPSDRWCCMCVLVCVTTFIVISRCGADDVTLATPASFAPEYCPYNVSIHRSAAQEPPRVGDFFSCSAYGSPSANYSWFNENGTLMQSGSSIVVTRPGPFRWTCLASSYVNGSQCNDSAQINATAYDCPHALLIKPSALPEPVLVGDFLNCTAVSFPASNFSWLDANGSVVLIGPRIDIVRPGPFNWTCVATLSVDGLTCTGSTSYSRPALQCPADLDISPSPERVTTLNQKYNCSSSGSSPAYAWYDDKGFKQSDTSLLTIAKTGESNYTCNATTRIQSRTCVATKSMPIYAIDCPHDVIIQQSAVPEPVLVGDYFNCSASSFPAANYSWYDSNGTLLSTGPVVHVTSPGVISWKCVATVSFDGFNCNGSKMFSATVSECPRVATIEPAGKQTAVLFDTFNCSLPGDSPSYSWVDAASDLLLSNTSSLTVVRTGLLTFTCEASIKIRSRVCRANANISIVATDNNNTCVSNPCQHGGSCINGVNSYSCRCLPGGTGIHCQTVMLLPSENAVPEFTGPHYIYNVSDGYQSSCVHYHFTCHVNYTRQVVDDGARFEVALTFDGQPSSASKITTSTELDVDFTPMDLRGHFGTNVSCSVRSFWVHTPNVTSDHIPSDSSYFVGIKCWTDNGASSEIQMSETASLLISFQLTVPVTCQQCSLSLPLSRHTGLTVSSCSVMFYSSDPPQTVRSINVRAVQTPGANSRVVFLEFFNVTSLCNDSAWDGYRQRYIPVLVVDELTAGSCSSDGDPHIRTFDSAFYSVYYEGDFVMWRSTSTIPAEVHVRFQQCQSLNVTASCNCAVAFREGDSIVGVYACEPDEPPVAIRYLRDRHTAEPSVRIGSDGLYFYITMPSGRAMSVSTVCARCGRLTITLYSISEDVGHAEGLCGNYNGLASDDTTLTGSTITESQEEPVKFAASYMLPTSQSFINAHIYDPVCQTEHVALPSECQCGQADTRNCIGLSAAIGPLDTALTYSTSVIDSCTSGRRKRMAEVDEPNANPPFGVITRDQFLPSVAKPPPNEPIHPNASAVNEISEDQAMQLCESSLTASPAYRGCVAFTVEVKDKIVKGCGLDVQLVGDADTVVRGMLPKYGEACRRGIQEGDTYNVTNAKKQYEAAVTAIPLAIDNPLQTAASQLADESATNGVCQKDCENNSTCSESICECTEGWTGSRCSVPRYVRPVINQWKLGGSGWCTDRGLPSCYPVVCDVRKKQCRVVTISVNEDTYSLSVTTAISRNTADNMTVYIRLEQASAITIGHTLPISPLDDDATSPNYTWSVSLTNSNETFSDELLFLVYDSTCMDCSGTTLSCGRLNSTCVIDGKCYLGNQTNTADPCFWCSPGVSYRSWTRGFVGFACTHPIDKPPEVTRLNVVPAFCDLRDPGSNCTLVDMTLNFDTYWDGVVAKCVTDGAAYYLSTSRKSAGEIFFNLPISPTDSASSSPNYTWTMSLSNDNATFGEEHLFFVFDSKCLECSNQTLVCLRKNNTCLIDGKCYVITERPYTDSCYGCLPEFSDSNWTRGWVGSPTACLHPIGQPPVVTGVKQGAPLCDIRVNGSRCTSNVVYAAENTFSDIVFVRFVLAAETYYATTKPSTAVEISFDFPMSPLDVQSTTPYYIWNVSVSNDNTTFSDAQQFVVFDSKCVECSVETKTCYPKSVACTIDGRCYADGENSTDECLVCSVKASNTTWTLVSSRSSCLATATPGISTTYPAPSTPSETAATSSLLQSPTSTRPAATSVTSQASTPTTSPFPSVSQPLGTSTIFISTSLTITTAVVSATSSVYSTSPAVVTTSQPETTTAVDLTTTHLLTKAMASTALSTNVPSTASSIHSTTADIVTTSQPVTTTLADMSTTHPVTKVATSTASSTNVPSTASSIYFTTAVLPTTSQPGTTTVAGLPTTRPVTTVSTATELSTSVPSTGSTSYSSTSGFAITNPTSTAVDITTAHRLTTTVASSIRTTATASITSSSQFSNANPSTQVRQTTASTAAVASSIQPVVLSTARTLAASSSDTGESTISAVPAKLTVTTPLPASSERLSGTTVAPSWSRWTVWSNCPRGCDGSRISSRSRTCLNGDICIGDLNQTLNCLMADCPVKVDEEGEGCMLKTALTNLSKFDDVYFLQSFFEVLIHSVNNYCTANKYSACKQLLAPKDNVEPADGWLTVATLSGVSIASGYPNTTGADSTIIKLLFKSAASRLRSQCSVVSSRRRRQTDDTVVYLDKDLLAAALNASTSNISTAADLTIYSIAPSADTTPVNTVTATATSVTSDATSTESATTSNRAGDTSMVVVVACVVSVAVVLLLLTVCGAFAVATRNQRPTTVRDARPRRFAGQFPYAPRSDFHTRPPYYFNK